MYTKSVSSVEEGIFSTGTREMKQVECTELFKDSDTKKKAFLSVSWAILFWQGNWNNVLQMQPVAGNVSPKACT